MNKHTLCSVVVPVYNEEESIEQTLTHLNQQIHSNTKELINKELFEIIIVDNNSTDQTCEKISKFSQHNPDLQITIITEKNQGVAWARKSGMDLAVNRSKQRDAKYNINRDFY